MAECPICVSQISVKKLVTCSECEKKSCFTCLTTFFDTKIEPNCPHCNATWTREFLATHFNSFDYSKMREKFLMHIEEAHLIETQQLLPGYVASKEAQKQLDIFTAKKKELTQELEMLQGAIATVRNKIFPNHIPTFRQKRSANETFEKAICRCPSEDCRGFVTDTEWTCGVCSIKVCANCLEIKQENHVCLEENIKTAKVIFEDCKACPTCAALIHRMWGCSQMFCTNCKKSFNWDTLKVVSNTYIHNPHFYEYEAEMRAKGYFQERSTEISVAQLFMSLPSFQVDKFDLQAQIQLFMQFTNHIHGTLPTVPEFDNVDVRLQYLNGEKTKQELASIVHQRDRKRECMFEKNRLIQDFFRKSNLIFSTYFQPFWCDQNMVNCVQEIDGLVEDFNSRSRVFREKLGSVSFKLIRFSKIQGNTTAVSVSGTIFKFDTDSRGFPVFSASIQSTGKTVIYRRLYELY